MIGLPGGIFNGGQNIFPLKKRVVGKNFFKRGVGSQKIQDIRNPNSKPADARAAPTLAFFYGNTLEPFDIHNPRILIGTGQQ